MKLPFTAISGEESRWEKIFFANYNFVLLAGNEVIFGDHVLIGPNCGIYARVMLTIPNGGTRVLSMPGRCGSAAMSGSEAIRRFSPV